MISKFVGTPIKLCGRTKRIADAAYKAKGLRNPTSKSERETFKAHVRAKMLKRQKKAHEKRVKPPTGFRERVGNIIENNIASRLTPALVRDMFEKQVGKTFKRKYQKRNFRKIAKEVFESRNEIDRKRFAANKHKASIRLDK